MFLVCSLGFTGNWQLEAGNCPTPMDFDQLQTFLEVARHASFSRAAEKRFRTQPLSPPKFAPLKTKSAPTLRPLRRQGLANRSRQGFSKICAGYSRRPQSHATSLAEMEHVPRGAIVVGANEGTCLHILPEVFADFKKQYRASRST